MPKNKLSGLGAYRELLVKIKDGDYVVVNPDEFIGPATVTTDLGLITEFSVTLRDRGIEDDNASMEYPRLNPENIGLMTAKLTFGYIDNPEATKKQYAGRLKEMRPQFPPNKSPQVELVFQASGWELTRVRRIVSYPHIEEKEIPEEEQIKADDIDIEIDPDDRSWAMVEDVEGTITLEDVIRNIIESYGYQVEMKIPHNVEFSGKDPLKQQDQTDWQFLTELGDEYGLSISTKIANDQGANLTDIYTFMVEPTSDVIAKEDGRVEFHYHIHRGHKVTEYDPSSKSTFIIMGEPQVTINSNWATYAQMEQMVGEDGQETFRLLDTNPQGEVITYDIDQAKLQGDPHGANKYAFDYVAGKAGWKEARPFFIKNTHRYGGSDKSGQERSRFQGMEMAFSTVGNPLAEIAQTYNIKGLGNFYSRGMVLTRITHTVDHKWMSSYEFKLME